MSELTPSMFGPHKFHHVHVHHVHFHAVKNWVLKVIEVNILQRVLDGLVVFGDCIMSTFPAHRVGRPGPARPEKPGSGPSGSCRIFGGFYVGV